MKTRILKQTSVIALAMIAALTVTFSVASGQNIQENQSSDSSGFARADDHRNVCTLETLRGRYVFTASGFNIVAGVAQPKAIVEVIVFNGDGTLAVPAATRSVNGVIVRSLPSIGTYTVEGNCTGTITFDGPAFDIFISRDREEIWMIQTNPNTVFQGTATRSSREQDRH